jgi:hypothetical protein
MCDPEKLNGSPSALLEDVAEIFKRVQMDEVHDFYKRYPVRISVGIFVSFSA